MALDRLLLDGASANASVDDETDSSSLSSHSSTLKGSAGSHNATTQFRPDRLNSAKLLPLGGEGPAPPSPGSARPPLEGISTEDTLRKMSIGKGGAPGGTLLDCQSRTITCRTPKDFFFIKVRGEGSFSTVGKGIHCIGSNGIWLHRSTTQRKWTPAMNTPSKCH